MVLRSKAQKQRDAYIKARERQACLHGKPKVTNVIPYKVTVGQPTVLRGSNYLHRKTARALPMRAWVAEA